jgi:hypothetical protein
MVNGSIVWWTIINKRRKENGKWVYTMVDACELEKTKEDLRLRYYEYDMIDSKGRPRVASRK